MSGDLKFGLRKARLGQLTTGYSAFESSQAFILYRSSSPIEAPLRQGHLWNCLYWGDYLGDEPHGRDWSGRRTSLPLSMNPRAPWINMLDVDAGFILLPLAARVGFSPGETIDFLLGLFGIDIAQDDSGRAAAAAARSDTGDPPRPVNPSFSITIEDAARMLVAMCENPKELERPVVILGGFLDSGLSLLWARDLEKVIGKEKKVIPVTFASCLTFDSCRSRLIEVVDSALPTDDPLWTSEVDVVAMSMGGLAARHSAAAPEDGASSRRRLKIARLFTISTPHRGAEMAMIPTFHPIARDMRPQSRFIRRLARLYPAARYELYPYVRYPDFVIDARNAAPQGETPWWIANPTFQSAHIGAMMDPRIQVEIIRRLGGEGPVATSPRQPLPRN